MADSNRQENLDGLAVQTNSLTTISSPTGPVSPKHGDHAEEDVIAGARSPHIISEPPGLASSNVVELSKDPFPDRFQRLNTLLGKGANKEVFLAFDTEENRDVAWNRVARQTLSQADHRVLQKEIEMMDQANHANIIKYLAWWDTENYFVFITDFFNMSLKQFIQERNVAINSVKTWTLQILEGLMHLHEAGIIHRDIKCDNVFINQKSGDVVIGDLGLSRNAGALDRSMSMVGTVPFMAPEQLNLDDRKYGPKVDIYALGMTLLEMISGEYPFEECNALPYIIKNIIDNKPPETLARLREGPTRDLVILCLTRNPVDRPTAKDLRQHTWFEHNKENFPVASLMLSDSVRRWLSDTKFEPDKDAIPPSAWSPGPFSKRHSLVTITKSNPLKRAGTYTAGDTLGVTPEPIPPAESPELKEHEPSEDLEARKFEQSISTMKTLTGYVKEAQRTLLPEDITSQMGEVDEFVEGFVNGSSVAHRSSFQNGSLAILEGWEQMRENFEEWSAGKQHQLQEREEKIKTQRDILNESRRKKESLSTQETDIRKQINTEHEKRQDLESRQSDIDQKIAELEEQKRQLTIEFDASKTSSSDLESTLHEVLESKENVEHNITDIEHGLADLTSDDQMNSDQDSHNQFLTWKESVIAVMNEIQKARELEWKLWDPQQIIDWICRLDRGTFAVYEEQLKTEIPSKIDSGEDLMYLTKDRQIIRELGVSKIRHRDMLLQHIERLNRNNPSDRFKENGLNPHV